MNKLSIALVALVGCVVEPLPPDDVAPISCSKTVTGPTSVGGGNTSCFMTVAITVTCPPGQSGRLESVYGEAPSATLYTASVDAAYQCNVPVTLTRNGFSCSASVAADVAFWTPYGAGPQICN